MLFPHEWFFGSAASCDLLLIFLTAACGTMPPLWQPNAHGGVEHGGAQQHHTSGSVASKQFPS
jgi:hypothetical protein